MCFLTFNHAQPGYRKLLSLVALSTALTLYGCSDNGPTAGGGAGDSPSAVPDAVALLTPFEGIYNLPSNWEGVVSDDAYIEITSPDAFGEASAIIYRVSSINNCIEEQRSRGEVTKDPTQDRVFLDELLSLDMAVLSLSGTDLVISLSVDTQDIDGDGDFTETPEQPLVAPRLAVMSINDLGEICQ